MNVSPEGDLPQGSARGGLLTELFGPNGDCKGYQLRLVGHSLGGSICALTGLRVRTNDTALLFKSGKRLSFPLI